MQGSVSLVLDGKTHDLTRLTTEEIVNLGVAMVPEGRRLFPRLTVEENLLLGAAQPPRLPGVALTNRCRFSPSLCALAHRNCGR